MAAEAVETGSITDPTHEATTETDAPAETVWAMVADVGRTGEWSPVCHTAEWIGHPARPVAGARFRGHNRMNGVRWSRECVVTEAEPGRVFAFSTTFRGEEQTRWRYTFEPVGPGASTRITEAYQVVTMPTWIRLLRLLPGVAARSDRDAQWNMGRTLKRLKAAAEGTPHE